MMFMLCVDYCPSCWAVSCTTGNCGIVTEGSRALEGACGGYPIHPVRHSCRPSCHTAQLDVCQVAASVEHLGKSIKSRRSRNGDSSCALETSAVVEHPIVDIGQGIRGRGWKIRRPLQTRAGIEHLAVALRRKRRRRKVGRGSQCCATGEHRLVARCCQCCCRKSWSRSQRGATGEHGTVAVNHQVRRRKFWSRGQRGATVEHVVVAVILQSLCGEFGRLGQRDAATEHVIVAVCRQIPRGESGSGR